MKEEYNTVSIFIVGRSAIIINYLKCNYLVFNCWNACQLIKNHLFAKMHNQLHGHGPHKKEKVKTAHAAATNHPALVTKVEDILVRQRSSATF